MDPIKNPFSPGAGAPPPELVGRDGVLQQAAVLLGRIKEKRPEKSLLLTGLRGVGKTVLLNEIERMAIDHGYRKPHPSIYEAALDAVGSAAEDAVFVGDALIADYLAPRNLGMRAFLIDPHRLHPIPTADRLNSILDLQSRIEILA